MITGVLCSPRDPSTILPRCRKNLPREHARLKSEKILPRSFRGATLSLFCDTVRDPSAHQS